MDDELLELTPRGKGQAIRLSVQQHLGGGPLTIFGLEAQKHDADIRTVSDQVFVALRKEFPNLTFRIRAVIKKSEIHKKLHEIDSRLGVILYVPSASIKPDGRVIEVQDSNHEWRVVLVSESKHQGNDIVSIKTGLRTPVMEKKNQFLMPAGNAIERVHKNIQEMKNFMLGEKHFPYVVFLQGSNFITETVELQWPDGPTITLVPGDSTLNRIDRVTSSNYGMKINHNYCKNLVVTAPNGEIVLQVTSIYAKCDHFTNEEMYKILMTTALESLEVLADDL